MPKYSAKLHKKISSKITYKNEPYFSVRQDKVKSPDGKTYEYNYLTRDPSVFIVPVTNKGNIIMVKQYRYLYNTTPLETVAGKTEPGLTLLESAKKELEEETGYQAKTWKKIGFFNPTSSVYKAKYHVFIAKDLKKVDNKIPEDEFEYIKEIEIPIKKVYQLLDNGKMENGPTIATLALARKYILK